MKRACYDSYLKKKQLFVPEENTGLWQTKGKDILLCLPAFESHIMPSQLAQPRN